MTNKRTIIFTQILIIMILSVNYLYSFRTDDVMQKFEKRSHTFENTTLPYRLFIPENYDSTKSYPMMLCLHGAGERGDDNNTHFIKHQIATAWADSKNQSERPCFVVAPQCPEKSKWNYVDWGKGTFNMDNVPVGNEMLTVINLLDALSTEFNIDPKRTYVTGLSMGGYGAWDIITRYPERFAAAIPMSGAGDPSKVNKFKDVSIWNFHNTADAIVPVEGSREMTEAMINYGLEVIQTLGMTDDVLDSYLEKEAKYLYTESVEGNHGPWEPWYNDLRLHKWVFAQSKKSETDISKFDDPFDSYLEVIPAIKQKIKIENKGSGETAITVESFTFSSRDNRNTVYAILAYPQGTGKYPGLMVLHGGGSHAEQLRNEVKSFAKAGYVAMTIDIPGICSRTKHETDNSSGPWKLVDQEEAPRFDVSEGPENSTLADGMIAGIEAFNFLSSHEKTDPSKMGITGYSWGGYSTTMLAGLLKERVTAAWAIYGCGFYDKGSFWTEIIEDLPTDDKATWLKFLDAGRRAPNITAEYFIDAPTNDKFFWPVAVQSTLNAISSPKNHVWGANLHHENMGLKPRDRFFEYHLKGKGNTFAKVAISKVEKVKGNRKYTIMVNIPTGVKITEVTLYKSLPNANWPEREWTSVPAKRVNDSTYTVILSEESVKSKVDFYVLVKDDAGASVATDMYSASNERSYNLSNSGLTKK